LGRRATTTMSGPLAAFADTSLRHIPQFNAKSPYGTHERCSLVLGVHQVQRRLRGQGVGRVVCVKG
jgi:hypothetical protein